MNQREHTANTHLGHLIVEITHAESEVDVYAAVARHLPHITPAGRVSVALFSPDRQTLEVMALHGTDGIMPIGVTMPAQGSMVGLAAREGKARIWQPDTNSPCVDAVALARQGIGSVINVPLVAAGKVLGCINLGAKQRNAFGEEEQQQLTQVAALIGANLERRHLLAEAQQAARTHHTYALRLVALNEIAHQLSAATTEQEMFASVAKHLPLAVPADRMSYAALQGDGTHFSVMAVLGDNVIPAGTMLPLAGTAVGAAVALGKVCASTPGADSPYDDHRLLGLAGLKASWSVPIQIGDDVIGVLNLATREPHGSDEAPEAILVALGRLLGATVGRMRAQAKAASALRLFIDASPVLQVGLNLQGIVQQVSHFGAATLGFAPEDLMGRHFATLHPEHLPGATAAQVAQWARLPLGQTATREAEMVSATGRASWARQSARLVDGDTSAIALLVVCEDITEIRQLTKNLELQTRTDALTGLPNRMAFDWALDLALKRAVRQGSRPSVLFLDLDRFKAVNDTQGHQAGDKLLCAVAQRIAGALRKTDMVSRTGGDEFQVLLPRIDSVEVAVSVAQAIRGKLETPFDIDGVKLHIGCSIGISCFPDDGTTALVLTQHADAAMYRAKELGRNNVQLYTPALSANLRSRMDIETALRKGIAHGELRLHLQPQFDLAGGQIRCVEALVRWQHPQRGLILPREFIAIAEETGLIAPITDWVLDNGLALLAQLRTIAPDLRLSVNVSPREFMDAERMIKRILTPLQYRGLSADCLELEISELALPQHAQPVRQVFASLRESGVHTAIDDFGTGYSSLSHLLDLPIDVLKIDRTLVDGVDGDSRKHGIVLGLVSMARSLGVVCVAKGVETQAQLDCLRAMDCAVAQGNLLARPAAASQITELVTSQRAKTGA